ncbi:15322_t:CDS:1, partial [Gigaspora margarita]
VAPHETQAESNEVTINEESTHDKKAGETPIITGTCPGEEMTAEPSDLLRGELSDLYGTAETKKICS